MPENKILHKDQVLGKIKNLIPIAKMGRPPKDNKLIFKVILWTTRNGTTWRDLPECFGSWKNIYNRFCKWRNTLDIVSHF